MKITDKQIREYILADPDHEKVVIKRNGEIHVRTDRQRGDGGSTSWWMFAGHRSDIAAEIQRNC
jgi:hypothetical protein